MVRFDQRFEALSDRVTPMYVPGSDLAAAIQDDARLLRGNRICEDRTGDAGEGESEALRSNSRCVMVRFSFSTSIWLG